MTAEARAAKNAYMRNWRKNNPDKVKANNAHYWERRAKADKEAHTEREPTADGTQ